MESRSEIFRLALAIQNERDDLKKLYSHAKKRLRDEFGVELDATWEKLVVDGAHDVPFPCTVDLEYNKMRRALRNVSLMARRMVNRSNKGGLNVTLLIEDLGHILRFCEESGVTPSVLRAMFGGPPVEATNAAVPRASTARPPNYDTSVGEGCDECGSTHGDTHSPNCTQGSHRQGKIL